MIIQPIVHFTSFFGFVKVGRICFNVVFSVFKNHWLVFFFLFCYVLTQSCTMYMVFNNDVWKLVSVSYVL